MKKEKRQRIAKQSNESKKSTSRPSLDPETVWTENVMLKQEIENLHKELGLLKNELKSRKQEPNKDRIITQLQREIAKLKRENRQLFSAAKGEINKSIRQACKGKAKKTASATNPQAKHPKLQCQCEKKCA